MKLVTILFVAGLCYLSLPVTTSVVAVGQSVEAEAAPAKAEVAAADDKKEAEAAKEEKPAAKNGEAAKEEAKKDEPAKDEEKEKKKERKIAKVEAKRVRVVATLEGTFTAEKMTPVALRPEEWSQFEIVEVVPHGTEVIAGQTLIKFDAKKFDEALADLELELHVSELAIRKAEEELPRLEKSLQMAADEAERSDKHVREDYDRFQKIERPMIVKSVDYSLKGAQFQLDYEQDELDQLEKMYEADDLTEDTEEVVLKRSKNSVDFAKFNLEQTKQFCDEILNIRLPRFDIDIKESLAKAGLTLAQAKTALAIDLTRARYELEQQKKMRTKALERHVKLLADRALMEIKAPVAGIVYYGECDNGSWSDVASMISKLKPENSVTGDTILMTIIERRPLCVLAQVGEAQRPEFTVGQAAKVVPPLETAAWMPAKLATLSNVPVATGKFDAKFDLTGEVPEWIVAGMSCKVKVATYDKADALVVPKKAVHTDKDDEEIKYVWLVDAEEDKAKDASIKAVRREVTLGKSSGENVEIVKGLKAGDVVSLDDEEKKDDEKDAE
jgi:HlyD family secretion protein